MSNEEKEHIHDEHCQCGCGEGHDDHEHHHEHEHEHGHEHEHAPVEVTTHDASVIGSYHFKLHEPYEKAKDTLDALLKEIARRVTEAGGIVGHIKAVVSAVSSCMISVTDEQADRHEIDSTECSAEGVAIVFCVTPDQLRLLLESVFKAYL